MSAIAGVAFLDGMAVEQGVLDRLALALKHRGSAGWASWGKEGVGLVHLKYRSTPESKLETQPAYDRTTNLAISADVRLDNRQELGELFGYSLEQLARISDSQLLLQAYARWGADCPAHLLGDFAFAIWEARNRRLFLARDPFGARALYYCYIPEHFLIFASEIKAIISYTHAPRNLNIPMIAAYLAGASYEGQHTPYQDILRLPAAHSLVLEPGAPPILTRYWHPDPLREVRLANDEEYLQAFHEVLSKAVQSRLRTTFPVGIRLSNEVSAAYLACLAHQQLEEEGRGPVHSFSITASEPEIIIPDRVSQATLSALTGQNGWEHHPIPVNQESLHHPDLLERFDHLSTAEFVFDGLTYSDAAREGVKILLLATGAETIIHSGYYAISELMEDRRWGAVLREAGALGKTLGIPRTNLLWTYAILPSLPVNLAQRWKNRKRKSQPEWDPWAVLHPDIISQIGPRPAFQPEVTGLADQRVKRSRLSHATDLANNEWQLTLEQSVELAYASGVEPAFPFFDRRVVEFCLGLPGDQKLRAGLTQYILHSTFRSRFPSVFGALQTQKERGFEPEPRLNKHEQQVIEELLVLRPAWLEGMLDIATLTSLLVRYQLDPLHQAFKKEQLSRIAALHGWMSKQPVSTT